MPTCGSLIDHVSWTSKSKEVLDSLDVVGSAVAYLADATVRTTAKSGGLLNSARRALWVKTWDGDSSSKNRLCGLPFTGSLLFGTSLDQALARSTEKEKKFPTKTRRDKNTFFSRPPGEEPFPR